MSVCSTLLESSQVQRLKFDPVKFLEPEQMFEKQKTVLLYLDTVFYLVICHSGSIEDEGS